MSLIAVHRAASGDAVRAIPLLEAAAGAALALGAATEAASFWRTAAELTTDPTEAAAYRSRAADALAAVGGTWRGVGPLTDARPGLTVMVRPATAGATQEPAASHRVSSSAPRAGA